MQQIATRIFIIASLAFGVLGIILVFSGPDGETGSTFDHVVLKCFMVTVFVILPSFALSVAGKYLNGNNK